MGHPTHSRAWLDSGVLLTAYYSSVALLTKPHKARSVLVPSIRGTVMMTDPSGALDEAVKSGLPHTKWLSRLLWLVDGDAGPEPGKSVEDKKALTVSDPIDLALLTNNFRSSPR